MTKEQALKDIFGFSAFRAFQEEAINGLLEGKDVLTVLPTGGGKSLCYQLPAVISKGVGVVISPLIALMQDQVLALQKSGISAAAINSDMSQSQKIEVFKDLKNNKIKLLYIAPERLTNSDFLEFLKSLQISFFVIDEAHCVSEWGHEFRSDYRKLNILKEQFGNTPIAAFTATATNKVKADIINALKLNNPLIISNSPFRSNLQISTTKRQGNGRVQILNFLNEHKNQSGIIYCFTRKECENLSAFLQDNGFNSSAYHAQIASEQKKQILKDFLRDEIEIIVATIAFGMGIDKSNIRYVLHTSLPKTLESYYQEIGRAGRDGLQSSALLLYSKADEIAKEELINSIDNLQYQEVLREKLRAMYHFAISSSCKHQIIANYFDYTIKPCGDKCSSCLAPKQNMQDITKEAQMVLSTIYRVNQKFGQNHIIDILRGSKATQIEQFNHHKLSTYNIGKDYSKEQWSAIIERLLDCEAINMQEHRRLKLLPFGIEILKSKATLEIAKDNLVVAKKSKKTNEIIKDAKFEALKELRLQLAKEQDVPAYIIFSDKTLNELAQNLPQTKEEMLQINGVGEVKFERYGKEFINLCKELSKKSYN